MPLTFDLSIDKLPGYAGRNPKPADFDKFWATGLAEMAAVTPDVELVPAEFECSFADCFHLYFTGVGGARIHAKYVRPKDAPNPHPAIVQFHGYADRIGDWAAGPMLAFAAQGFSYIGMDCRGQGGLSEDRGIVRGNTLRGHIVRGLEDALQGAPEKLLFRNIFLDTAQITRLVMGMDEVDADRVGVWGGSQGGGLTVACSALVPEVAKLAPVFPFLSDYRRVWEMDQAKNAYLELSEWFRRFDPLHQREAEVFSALGYIDIQHLAERVRGEVLWRIGLADQVCPPSTQYAAYNKLTAAKKMVTYPDYAHEKLPMEMDQLFAFMAAL
ncbi:acetylxylan esterase [Devosia algicola]|uniref:Acetylxylan esterase n=1 Tax=Devosia algicola TaxID=3026418 RepID=A0ABY7YN33_9HYPH|nr:acetylxylan esterase [Devosia algicola]WDR02592.1 acetylxylan esterase [Devosia algicola]